MLKSENRWACTQTFPSTFDLEMNLLNTAIILTLVLSTSHSHSSISLYRSLFPRSHSFAHFTRWQSNMCSGSPFKSASLKTTLFLCACASDQRKEWLKIFAHAIQSVPFDDQARGGTLRISQAHTHTHTHPSQLYACLCRVHGLQFLLLLLVCSFHTTYLGNGEIIDKITLQFLMVVNMVWSKWCARSESYSCVCFCVLLPQICSVRRWHCPISLSLSRWYAMSGCANGRWFAPAHFFLFSSN